MDLFKLIGSIFIKNQGANESIDETTSKAKNMAEKVGSSMKTAGDKISKVGKALAPISAIAGTALGASIKGASDFTDGMAKMSTLFDTTEVSLKDLSKEFLELSNKTGIAGSELAEAGYQALSAGVDVDKSVAFVETAGKLAKAGFTSTTTAVDVLTTAMNAYGDEAGTAEEISNKLVRTQNLGKTTVDELASAMGKVIPTASSMGVNIDNLTSGYVALTKQGIATAEATTYMNSMMNELGDSGTKLGGIIKDKTGMSFQECMESGMSLADVLQITKDYADENNIAYNELWGSAEAGKAGLSILNGGVEEFNDTVGIMSSKTDDVSEALDKLETPAMKAKKAFNRIKNSGIELGTTLLGALAPAIDKISGAIEKATNWFNGLSDGTKTAIGTFLAFVAGLAPVLMIVGKLTSGIGGLITHFSGAIGKITSLISSSGGLSGALSALTSPVGLVIGAIAGLIAIFVALYQNNEEFRTHVNEIWDSVKEKISIVIDGIKELIGAFIEFFKQLWDSWGADIVATVQSAFDFVMSIISTSLDVVHNIISLITSLIKGDWSGVWEAIKNILKSVWDGIKNIISTGVEMVKNIISLALNVIKTVFSTIWNSIKNLVATVWDAIKNKISSILENIKSVVSNAWEAVKNTISNAIQAVKDRISNGLQSAKDTVTNKLNSIKEKFSSIFESAKNIVRNAIDRIKGFFNFSWSLPHLKMPHISISGKFGLLPPSVPHFSIDWYKKAMDSPKMFTKPTLFDVNPMTGTAKGAGEAGDEIMYGKNRLMNDISNAVGSNNNGIIDAINDAFDKLFDILSEWFPQFNSTLVLDTGVLVAETAPMMDEELGIIQKRKGR